MMTHAFQSNFFAAACSNERCCTVNPGNFKVARLDFFSGIPP